jgi:hypothetical protein
MTYTFTTEDPIEAQRIIKSLDMAIAISKIRVLRKSYLKHRDVLTEDQHKIAEEIFDDLYNLFNSIDIDEILE